MPSIQETNVAAGTSNALDGKKFQKLDAPALISLYGSTAANGGTLSFSVGSEDFLKDAEVNVEASADVVDTDRDQLLFREPVPAGEMFLEVGAQICNYLLVIEPVG